MKDPETPVLDPTDPDVFEPLADPALVDPGCAPKPVDERLVEALTMALELFGPALMALEKLVPLVPVILQATPDAYSALVLLNNAATRFEEEDRFRVLRAGFAHYVAARPWLQDPSDPRMPGRLDTLIRPFVREFLTEASR